MRCEVAGHDWVQIAGDFARYELHVGATVFVIVQRGDHWRAGMIEPNGTKTILVNAGSLDSARQSAEARATAIVKSLWRRQRATIAQRERAEQLKIELHAGITKGEASDLLSIRLAELQARKETK